MTTTKLLGNRRCARTHIAVAVATAFLSTIPVLRADESVTIEDLKAMIASQQKQIEELQTNVKKQQQTLDKLTSNPSTTYSLPSASKLGEVATMTPMIPSGVPAAQKDIGPTNQPASEHKSPLGFQIGDATFTPLGFMDFTMVWRSTAIGTGIGTTFSGAPFNNNPLGQLPETHFSNQNSRLGLKVDSDYHDMHVRGYLEADFLGNPPANLAVTSNSDTLRMRLYWVQLTKGHGEFLAGQSWSMMTPNRKGISPLPGDIFYSQDVDTNYQAGLVWTRAAQIRAIYHGGDHFTWGFALENPEQYIGGAVVLPATLPAAFASSNQFNAGANTLATPNYTPDIQSKIAFDGKRAHIEIAGILRTFHDFIPAAGMTAAVTHTAIGAGGELNSNFEIAPGLRLIENAYWSDGGGRYIASVNAPDVIVRADGSISPVHSGSTVDGFEWTVGEKKNTLIYGYYGGTYIRRNVAVDSAGKLSGYGVPGSGAANRTVQEATFGWTQTFWKNERYGDVKLMTQYSYLWRNPWLASPPTPKEAHSNMIWVNVRYDLP